MNPAFFLPPPFSFFSALIFFQIRPPALWSLVFQFIFVLLFCLLSLNLHLQGEVLMLGQTKNSNTPGLNGNDSHKSAKAWCNPKISIRQTISWHFYELNLSRCERPRIPKGFGGSQRRPSCRHLKGVNIIITVFSLHEFDNQPVVVLQRERDH